MNTSNPTLPRDDYPRPQFRRDSWENLNGIWEFAFDDDNQGENLGWHEGATSLPEVITVPFTYQTELSGIDDQTFHDIVWYRRIFNLPASWLGNRLLLHFGAVDYRTTVWCNGKLAGVHEGGQASFSIDITRLVAETNVLVVQVRDSNRDVTQPRGKQYWQEQPKDIFYTGTTGIWQTVWLEPLPQSSISSVRFTPDIDSSQIGVDLVVSGISSSKRNQIKIEIHFIGCESDPHHVSELVSQDTITMFGATQSLRIELPCIMYDGYTRWWTPETPNLYEVSLTLQQDGDEIDRVQTYFGMRKVSIEGGAICLNNRPYYMRLVLDQGYYPGGGLTAPTDDDLKRDITLAKQMGFNGARKHQKVEDPRWLYWCDKIGFLTWEEMANAYDYSNEYVSRIVTEWLSIVERDYNHPCIVAWVPLNESWGVPNIHTDPAQQSHATAMYHLTKSLDQTRLSISNDGWEHTCSDICSIHDYDPDGHSLELRYSTKETVLRFMPAQRNLYADGSAYSGEPIMVTEFGGIAFNLEAQGWGYSSAHDASDFLKRLDSVVHALKQSRVVQGYCYTQLTDVEQETNGLLTATRLPKADLAAIREIIVGPNQDDKRLS